MAGSSERYLLIVTRLRPVALLISVFVALGWAARKATSFSRFFSEADFPPLFLARSLALRLRFPSRIASIAGAFWLNSQSAMA